MGNPGGKKFRAVPIRTRVKQHMSFAYIHTKNSFVAGGQATFYINQEKIQQHIMNGRDEENPEKYIVYRKCYYSLV